jgi:hypothetical protein
MLLLSCIACGPIFAQVRLEDHVVKPELISGSAPRDPYPNLYYLEKSEGDYYFLQYVHGISKEPDLRSLEFFATPNELETLYQFFKGSFDSGKPASIFVGSKTISISPAASREGVPYVFVVIHSPLGDRSNFFMNNKSLDRVFGKK